MCGGSKGVPETPEEIELAQIASERWEDYKQKFIPVENQAISDVTKEFDNPSEFGANVANTSTQMAFSPVEASMARGLTTRGAGPGSGAFTGGIVGLNTDRAASSGLGQANAYGVQRTQNLQNMQSLINMGQGQAGSGLSGLGDAATLAQRNAFLDSRASAAARAALGQAAGAVAGGVGSYYANLSSGGSSPQFNSMMNDYNSSSTTPQFDAGRGY